jgi:hypothetical protein
MRHEERSGMGGPGHPGARTGSQTRGGGLTTRGKVSPATIEHYLKGIKFPASKEDLLRQAGQHNAPHEVIETIEDLPGDRFNSPIDISKAFGQMK